MTGEMREALITIRNFLKTGDQTWEWKDFLSIPASEPAVLRLQELCLDLPFQYPPEEKGAYCSADGMERLQDVLAAISESSKTAPQRR